jgi:hypothetical protein
MAMGKSYDIPRSNDLVLSTLQIPLDPIWPMLSNQINIILF